MSKAKAWMTNTKALYSTHKKRLLQNQLLKLMELNFCNARFYNTNLQLLFPLFPVLFTYKGAGI